MTASVKTPVLSLEELFVRLRAGSMIVEDVSLELGRGQILGLVGESGSGKTSTARALLGYCGAGVMIDHGALQIGGETLQMDDSMRRSRGCVVSYVPQNPGRSLNPALRIADSIRDLLKTHRAQENTTERVAELLDIVGLPSTPDFMRRFPHQLSGGQQQRVCIAAALSCRPSLVVLDEPTTGLDVVTQQRILDQLCLLRDSQGISMVYVTHDLAVVSQVADEVAVMYAGRVVEQGPTREVLRQPRHPYTRGLLASIPDHVRPGALKAMPGISVGVGERPTGCAFAPRCEQCQEDCTVAVPPLLEVAPGHLARCLHSQRTAPVEFAPLPPHPHESASVLLEVKDLSAGYGTGHSSQLVAREIGFQLERSSCLALVGESGSGKTTLARTIAGLHPVAGGEIWLDGARLPSLVRKRSVAQRRRIQFIFQNPADALNPRHTVGQIIARPARLLRGLSRDAATAEAERLLDEVRLPRRVMNLYPGELSGGEAQRVSIARALAADPEILLCDEVTSALDVSVQAAVLQVLRELREQRGLAMLFVTHDLGVVAAVADEILVLENGLISERGSATAILQRPSSPYTQTLLGAAPSLSASLAGWHSPSAV